MSIDKKNIFSKEDDCAKITLKNGMNIHQKMAKTRGRKTKIWRKGIWFFQKLKMPYQNCYHVLTNIRPNKKQKYERNQIIGVPGIFKNTSLT